MSKKYVAFGELLLATLTWGFGFPAAIWAIQCVDVVSLSLIRFGTSFLVGLFFVICSKKWRREWNREQVVISSVPGLLIGLMMAFQTWSMEFTSATNSSFLTTLYVVVVPFFEVLFLGQKLPLRHFLWVALALLGTALMVNFHSTALNQGDAYALICSTLAALHIVWIGRVQKKITSPFMFNAFQSFWGFVASLLFWPLYGKAYFNSPDLTAIIGITSLTLGSTIIAFALQVKAQKVLSPSLASLIFLMESPFAMIFAVILIHESISSTQMVGGALIFLAAMGATFINNFNRQKGAGKKL